MGTRRRIRDSELHAYEDEIALANLIMREARALGLDLDVDTLSHVHRRLTRIIEAAAAMKARRIAAMNGAKDAVAGVNDEL
jgi:hypothetical protein